MQQQLDEPFIEEPLDLKEAAAFVRLPPSSLRRLAKAGKMPGQKAGKHWRFLRSELTNYLRGYYNKPVTPEHERKTWRKKYTREGTSFGSDSHTQALTSRLDSVRAQVLGKKLKNS
jgi:excisionase family DNA binding protein